MQRTFWKLHCKIISIHRHVSFQQALLFFCNIGTYYCIYLFACICMCVVMCVPQHVSRGQKTAIGSQFSPSLMWVQIVRFGHKHFCLLRSIARPVTQHRFLSFLRKLIHLLFLFFSHISHSNPISPCPVSLPQIITSLPFPSEKSRLSRDITRIPYNKLQ